MRKIALAIGISLPALFGLQAFTSTQDNFIAHEWGTYTSVQGSDGVNVQGLHHGDERLPYFVHCPLGSGLSYGRCLDLLRPEMDSPLSVTQRLETPVIYFHSAQARHVNVEVDFPEGIFSEWYPAAQDFTPAPDTLTEVRNGSIAWSADIVTRPLEIPAVSANSIWAPSRRVNANYLQAGGENEQFIFYRGLGKFDTAFRTSSDSNGNLTVSNTSGQGIPAAFLISVTKERGSIQHLGVIPAHGEIHTPLPATPGPDQPVLGEFIKQAKEALKKGLVASGLYDDESQAMVDTWEKNYFKIPGTRILYMAPREWTDAILPIRITPQPTELVRTLVGRVEILSQAEEKALLTNLKRSQETGEYFPVEDLGRFAEPKLWRARKQTTDAQLIEYIDQYLGWTQ